MADDDKVDCTHCGASLVLSTIVFDEPDEDSDTQYGWLVGKCPSCSGDLEVEFAQVRTLLDSKHVDQR